jgi:hypothetical protein
MPTFNRAMSGLAVLTLVLPCSAVSQQFEGVLTMRETRFEIDAILPKFGGSADSLLRRPLEDLRTAAEAADAGLEELTLTYYIKGNKLRTSNAGSSGPGADEGYMILDFGTGSYQLVDPTQNMVIEWVADSAEVSAVQSEDAATESGADVRPLDETRTINGFACRGYRTLYEGGIVEVTWLTDTLRDLTAAFAELAALSQRFGDEGGGDRRVDRFLEHGFPILTMTIDPELGEFSAAEVMKATRQAVGDTLFTVPAGYLKVAMPKQDEP